jgi:hypothetical protein
MVATQSNGVRLASYQAVTGHNIPDVLWNWMNSPANGFRQAEGVDWVYVLGLPITEPFWIDSTVGGVTKRVLVQLFERRVLTYTPSNPLQYQIEFGNIGLHYYQWRYVDSVVPTPTATSTATATPTSTPTEQSPTVTSTSGEYPARHERVGSVHVFDGLRAGLLGSSFVELRVGEYVSGDC